MYHATKSKGKRGYKGIDRKEYIRAEHLKVKSWKNIKIWAVRQYEKGMPVKDIKLMIGVSRTAIYDWIGLYTAFGKEIFNPKPRRPKNIRRTPRSITEKILEVREKTHYGCEKIAIVLKETSHMNVYRTLVAFGKIEGRGKKRRRWHFFERKHPNALWQMDLKQLSENEWSISIIDDFSRYIVGCSIYKHVPSVDDVIDLLEETIARETRADTNGPWIPVLC